MKKTLFLTGLVSLLGFSSCEKCFDCKGKLPIYTNGQVVGEVEDEQSFCGKGANVEANRDAYEQEGYTCVEKK